MLCLEGLGACQGGGRACESPRGVGHAQASCFWVSHLRGGGAEQAGHRDSLVPTQPGADCNR